MNEVSVLKDIFIDGNLSWGNMALLGIIGLSIVMIVKLRAYLARKGQKAQAVKEIKAMPCYAIDSIIDLPTATGVIPATIEGIADDSFVVLSGDKRKFYIPVAQFASGSLGNRIAMHIS